MAKKKEETAEKPVKRRRRKPKVSGFDGLIDRLQSAVTNAAIGSFAKKGAKMLYEKAADQFLTDNEYQEEIIKGGTSIGILALIDHPLGEKASEAIISDIFDKQVEKYMSSNYNRTHGATTPLPPKNSGVAGSWEDEISGDFDDDFIGHLEMGSTSEEPEFINGTKSYA